MPARRTERETSGDGSSSLKRWARRVPEGGCERKQRRDWLSLRSGFLSS